MGNGMEGKGPIPPYTDPVRAAVHSWLKGAEGLRADAAKWRAEADDFEAPLAELQRKAERRRKIADNADREADRLTQAATALVEEMGYTCEPVPGGERLRAKRVAAAFATGWAIGRRLRKLMTETGDCRKPTLEEFRAELGICAEGMSDEELQQLQNQVEWFARFAVEHVIKKWKSPVADR